MLYDDYFWTGRTDLIERYFPGTQRGFESECAGSFVMLRASVP